MRLNIISDKLTVMMERSSIGKLLLPIGKNLAIRAKIPAMTKFDNGPARATRRRSREGLRKLKGLTGTGFAQPKTKPVPVRIKNAGNRIVPIGSIWLIGFKLTRPSTRAVGSPSLSAA